MQRQSQVASSGRVGWRLDRWCEDAGISRAQFYRLPPDLAPRSTQLSPRRRIVTESPADWLARVGKAHD